MDNAKADSLGFADDPVTFRTDPARDVARACFRVRKVLEGIVHDTVALAGNPFTLPEVKTLLDRVTSRLMMNGTLLGAGEDAISVPARRRLNPRDANNPRHRGWAASTRARDLRGSR